MKLTKRAVETATYTGQGNDRCVVWDSELKGFGLRVYPTGKKAFVVSYRPRGEMRKRLMTLGAFGVLTVEQARDMAKNELHSVRQGKDPLEERVRRDVSTFGELADRYLEEYAKPHRKTWKEDERRLNKYVLPALRNRPVNKVTSAEVRKLHAKIGKVAPVEANRVANLIRAIYNRGKKWELVPQAVANPAGGVDRFKERPRERWLTAKEIERLATALHDAPHPYGEAIRLLLLTGCRKTELLRARWDRLDLDARRLLLEDTKTGEPKVQPLSPPAVTILRAMPRRLHSPWIFPGPDAKKPLQDIKKAWKVVREAAKVPDATIHDLRRTTGSWLIQRGVPLKVVGAALGHRDTRSTEVYARIAAQQPAEALDMLGEAFGGLLDAKEGA
jgi:integrase